MNGLSDHKWPFLQRLAHYRPDSFPVDIDVFPYTLAEIQAGQPIAQEALRNGRIRMAPSPLSYRRCKRDELAIL